MTQQRGLNVDPSTIFRWAQRYAPESAKGVMPTGPGLFQMRKHQANYACNRQLSLAEQFKMIAA
jgi:transposase-like protein